MMRTRARWRRGNNLTKNAKISVRVDQHVKGQQDHRDRAEHTAEHAADGAKDRADGSAAAARGRLLHRFAEGDRLPQDPQRTSRACA